MSITPLTPAENSQGGFRTWVKSQRKFLALPGQLSAEINTHVDPITPTLRFPCQPERPQAEAGVETDSAPAAIVAANAKLSTFDLVIAVSIGACRATPDDSPCNANLFSLFQRVESAQAASRLLSRGAVGLIAAT
jgi:hypothetical protein